jgi:hypothetical protein
MKTGFVISFTAALALTIFGAVGAQAAHRMAPAPKTCGGFGGGWCGDGEFCQHKTGSCFIPDMTGICVKVPKICGKHILPVCGCNGVTYHNGCEAEQAMVSIAHKGACKP